MQIGRVIGTANSTIKHPSMQGRKLLIVQPQLADNGPDGDPILAVDCIGAGVSDDVMLTSDGARKLLNVDTTPVRWTIIGIRD
ncbi:MAG: EutN/CcmL family microcompartment protein [Pirellulaceae bacterium]|jgi:ethanolamine utilization protein EutN|nr:EutN/CcmL family microcompartment protein [Pirellulaceae bacterium]MDP7303478.1 EutN/CcmL family microcompartment protein [Pirellulaceae bacterium]HJN09316.1 EutN/CcmL family microcompartment protein [Pirellulaceae bacterium]